MARERECDVLNNNGCSVKNKPPKYQLLHNMSLPPLSVLCVQASAVEMKNNLVKYIAFIYSLKVSAFTQSVASSFDIWKKSCTDLRINKV